MLPVAHFLLTTAGREASTAQKMEEALLEEAVDDVESGDLNLPVAGSESEKSTLNHYEKRKSDFIQLDDNPASKKAKTSGVEVEFIFEGDADSLPSDEDAPISDDNVSFDGDEDERNEEEVNDDPENSGVPAADANPQKQEPSPKSATSPSKEKTQGAENESQPSTSDDLGRQKRMRKKKNFGDDMIQELLDEDIDSVPAIKVEPALEDGEHTAKKRVRNKKADQTGQKDDDDPTSLMDDIDEEYIMGTLQHDDFDVDDDDSSLDPTFSVKQEKVDSAEDDDDITFEPISKPKRGGKGANKDSLWTPPGMKTKRRKKARGGKTVCDECGHKALCNSALQKHIMRKHTGEKPLACDLCSYRCIDLTVLRKHRANVHKEQPQECPLCGYKTNFNAVLRIHMNREHPGETPFHCDLCPYKCDMHNTLLKHARTHDDVKPYKCCHCSFRTAHPNSLDNHIRLHTGEKPFKCKYCDYRAAHPTTLYRHTRVHTGEKPYKCELCPYTTSQSWGLSRHYWRHHSDEKPYHCDLCEYKTSTNIGLQDHIRTHTGEKPFLCPHCTYRTTSANNLRSHVKVHSGEKPFVCNECGYRAMRKFTIKKHMITHANSENREHRCPYCPVKAKNLTDLREHKRKFHSGEKRYECGLCPYKTTKNIRLQRHVLKQHSDSNGFVCNECGYKAKRVHAIKNHMKLHDKSYLPEYQQGVVTIVGEGLDFVGNESDGDSEQHYYGDPLMFDNEVSDEIIIKGVGEEEEEEVYIDEGEEVMEIADDNINAEEIEEYVVDEDEAIIAEEDDGTVLLVGNPTDSS
ncbi:Hypothetical protein NTJ_02058 [Nesidiocoris tenuis]|uniref:C2H2-type domain-containing protein n=2 Tax=Nesidiocoris tenuis TaxID=355587 RepID=A0ABN7AEF5_9HEMI|nr:Hypothetical protein NTJ_02058 [Nesidiocoris tenuis]